MSPDVAVLEAKVLALDIPEIIETLSKRVDGWPGLDRQIPIVATFPSGCCARAASGHYRTDRTPIRENEFGTFQAVRDTARAPGEGDDWVLIARGGRDAILPRVCGLYKKDAEYRPLDIVALNGSSFISKKDNAGPCPGPGWQLLASAGRTGSRGEKGDKGEPGAQGPRGVGTPGASITGWTIDAENYLAIPLMSDGKKGPPLELRGFFKQFLSDAR